MTLKSLALFDCSKNNWRWKPHIGLLFPAQLQPFHCANIGLLLSQTGRQSIYFILHNVEKRVPGNCVLESHHPGPAVTFRWTWVSAAGWGAPELSGDYIAICSSGLLIRPVLTFQNSIQWNSNLRTAGRQNLLLEVSFTAELPNCPLQLVKGPLGSGHELSI